MRNDFIACALDLNDPAERELLAHQFQQQTQAPALVLNTCQRLEVFGRQDLEAHTEAWRCEAHAEQDLIRRIARIAAGLDSRIIGELEILGQVREAYRNFHQRFGKDDPKLDRIFQRALALARKARKVSGVDQNLTGLAALTARRIIGAVPEDAPVTIIGSGSLAKSVARYLGKRTKHPVRISSRCPENAMKLAMEVGGFASGLDELAHVLQESRVIVTATAAPHPVLFSHHLLHAAFPRLILDLGEPPDCETALQQREDVEYVGLLEIESLAQSNTETRRERAALAEQIILQETKLQP